MMRADRSARGKGGRAPRARLRRPGANRAGPEYGWRDRSHRLVCRAARANFHADRTRASHAIPQSAPTPSSRCAALSIGAERQDDLRPSRLDIPRGRIVAIMGPQREPARRPQPHHRPVAAGSPERVRVDGHDVPTPPRDAPFSCARRSATVPELALLTDYSVFENARVSAAPASPVA